MSGSIYNYLVQMGYSPNEQGDYFRCTAVYRGGDNPTALSVHKASGRWSDFPQGISNAPFEKLIQLTLGESHEEFLEKYKLTEGLSDIQEVYKKDDYMKNDVYSPSLLNSLLNLYTFYEKRGITRETQNAYLAGYASSGKMYGRMVFPIYDECNQIIGFAGRDVYERHTRGIPKWKIIGKKKNFVYPFFLPLMREKFFESFDKNKEVVIVESIGDSMALYQQGIFNNLVIFGLNGGDGLFGFLNRLNPQKIIISLNNDKNSEINRGLIGAIKVYTALSGLFSVDKLEIRLPLMNDFGDMISCQDEEIFNKWKEKAINQGIQREYIKRIMLQGHPELFTKKEQKQISSTL